MAKPTFTDKIRRAITPREKHPRLAEHPLTAAYYDPEAEPPAMTEGVTIRVLGPGSRLPEIASGQLMAARADAAVEAKRRADAAHAGPGFVTDYQGGH